MHILGSWSIQMQRRNKTAHTSSRVWTCNHRIMSPALYLWAMLTCFGKQAKCILLNVIVLVPSTIGQRIWKRPLIEHKYQGRCVLSRKCDWVDYILYCQEWPLMLLWPIHTQNKYPKYNSERSWFVAMYILKN